MVLLVQSGRLSTKRGDLSHSRVTFIEFIKFSEVNLSLDADNHRSSVELCGRKGGIINDPFDLNRRVPFNVVMTLLFAFSPPIVICYVKITV